MDDVVREVEDLDFSVRTWRNLKRSGIDSVDQLLLLIQEKMWNRKVVYCSRAVAAEIAAKLDEEGLMDFSSVAENSEFGETELRKYQYYQI